MTTMARNNDDGVTLRGRGATAVAPDPPVAPVAPVAPDPVGVVVAVVAAAACSDPARSVGALRSGSSMAAILRARPPRSEDAGVDRCAPLRS